MTRERCGPRTASMKRFWFLILGIVALGLGLGGAGFALSRVPDFQLFGTLVTRVETEVPVVALTFDDGPTDWAHEVAALLADKHVRATFFVTGREAAENPRALKALIAGGHEMGNHSYSHPRMIVMAPGRVALEIEDTDAVLRQAGYAGPIPFRPPFGKKLITLPLYLARHDRASIMWSMAPESDPAPTEDPALIAERTIQNARPGDIILLHPMYNSRAATRAALPAIIDGLRARGFALVTLSELLEQQPPQEG